MFWLLPSSPGLSLYGKAEATLQLGEKNVSQSSNPRLEAVSPEETCYIDLGFLDFLSSPFLFWVAFPVRHLIPHRLSN